MATEKELKKKEAALEARERAIAEKEEALAPKKGETVPAKYLKGLTFAGADGKEVLDKKLNKKKTVYTPYERPLEPGDVMSWMDNGDRVVIATKDGKKHEVAKGK